MNKENHSKDNERSMRQPDSASGDAAQDADSLLSTAEGRAAAVRDMDAAIEKLFAKHRPAAAALLDMGTTANPSKTDGPRAFKRFRVMGDSFAAFSLLDGHELVVDPLGAIQPGALVVASLSGGMPSVRRVVEVNGELLLEAADLSRAPRRGAAGSGAALLGVVVTTRPGM